MFSGLVTFFMNRVGDGFILIAMSYYFYYSGFFVFITGYFNFFYFFLLIVGLLSKRAQFPFNSWLPVAMSAPTPVSSLVHSSTLVTAGILMLFKFYDSLSNVFIESFVLGIGLITMFLGRIMAIYSYDLKKVVAYSTLSQIGLLVVVLLLGGPLVSMYYMIIHAFFKSMMFILVGMEILNMNLVQDVRMFFVVNRFGGMMFFMVILSNLNLIGIPLMAG